MESDLVRSFMWKPQSGIPTQDEVIFLSRKIWMYSKSLKNWEKTITMDLIVFLPHIYILTFSWKLFSIFNFIKNFVISLFDFRFEFHNMLSCENLHRWQCQVGIWAILGEVINSNVGVEWHIKYNKTHPNSSPHKFFFAEMTHALGLNSFDLLDYRFGLNNQQGKCYRT